jgi:DNA-binding protein
MTEDNIHIGRKGAMEYVLAVVTQFCNGSTDIIKARGKAISRAAEAAEIVRHRFVRGAAVKDVRIGTELVTDENGSTNISSIEIVLSR